MMQRSEPMPPATVGVLFGHDTGNETVRELLPDVRLEIAVLDFQPVEAVVEREREAAAAAMEEEVVPRATEPEQEAAMLRAAACADAAAEARRQMETHTEARVLAERRRVTEVCDRFARDRQRYFATAEEQVVRLALAIAERVLHREAKADPLLLSSAVRAALARVREGSAAVLRVPRAEQELWASIFPEGSEPIVTIAPDDRMSSGDCVLETIVGRVELGVSVQLEEIGRGFGELAHPYDAPPPPSPEEETVASTPSINLTGNLFDFSVLSTTEGN